MQSGLGPETTAAYVVIANIAHQPSNFEVMQAAAAHLHAAEQCMVDQGGAGRCMLLWVYVVTMCLLGGGLRHV